MNDENGTIRVVCLLSNVGIARCLATAILSSLKRHKTSIGI